jgi:hypothetical protein
MIGNMVRWRWRDVEHHIDVLNGLAYGDTGAIAANDEYSANITRLIPRPAKKARDD